MSYRNSDVFRYRCGVGEGWVSGNRWCEHTINKYKRVSIFTHSDMMRDKNKALGFCLYVYNEKNWWMERRKWWYIWIFLPNDGSGNRFFSTTVTEASVWSSYESWTRVSLRTNRCGGWKLCLEVCPHHSTNLNPSHLVHSKIKCRFTLSVPPAQIEMLFLLASDSCTQTELW